MSASASSKWPAAAARCLRSTSTSPKSVSDSAVFSRSTAFSASPTAMAGSLRESSTPDVSALTSRAFSSPE
ncbi:MAG: hypothetical protein QM765_00095 [Myxococcales bacterium]